MHLTDCHVPLQGHGSPGRTAAVSTAASCQTAMPRGAGAAGTALGSGAGSGHLPSPVSCVENADTVTHPLACGEGGAPLPIYRLGTFCI